MHLRIFPHDRQTDTGALYQSVGRKVATVKRLEYELTFFRGDTRPLIAHIY
jgi:hypothetical protein